MGEVLGGEALHSVIRQGGQAEVLHDVEKELFADRVVQPKEAVDVSLGLIAAEAIELRPIFRLRRGRGLRTSDDVDHRLGFGLEPQAQRLDVGFGERLWPVAGGQNVEDLRRGIVVGGVGLQEAQARQHGRHLP
jgi:hypothetical protein